MGGRDGQTIKLNDLLPFGYKIVGGLKLKEKLRKESVEYDCEVVSEQGDTAADTKPEIREVALSGIEARERGWKYLLLVLHEIGHAVYAELKPGENAEKLQLYENQPTAWIDPELFRKITVLTSRDEREAWAFALKNFRKIVKKLGLPGEKIFPSHEEIKKFVKRHLGSYKQEGFIEDFDVPGEQKQELREEMRKLFVKNFSKGDWRKLIEDEEN